MQPLGAYLGAMSGSRTALVIGNSAYPGDAALRNARRDGEAVGRKLESLGFDVELVLDGTFRAMDDALKRLRSEAEGREAALLYFAGHALQIDGENYLLGIDTDVQDEDDAAHSALGLKKVLKALERSDAGAKIVILDACRTNPFERRWRRAGPPSDLAPVLAPKGTLIAFSTSPGEIARDGSGSNGAYTSALLQHIDVVDLPIEPMLKRVRNTLAANTRGRQTSWEHTSLSGEFHFAPGLGRTITEYGPEALADDLFLVDAAKPSHKVIEGLRSLTWGRQNPAVKLLTAATVAATSNDTLFVTGRNLYQAACGNAHEAIGFIADFAARTSTWDQAKAKAVLDGMLFEVFFSADGKLRDKPKTERFEEIFDLERYARFKPSFDFIADALRTARARFPVLPGTGSPLSVTIHTGAGKTGPRVNGVFIGSVDYLRPPEEGLSVSDATQRFMTLSKERLARTISQELAVPERLLHIAYSPAEAGKSDTIGWPVGWSVKP
ncbi:caspase domain-containing protein [Sphingomonas olei]